MNSDQLAIVFVVIAVFIIFGGAAWEHSRPVALAFIACAVIVAVPLFIYLLMMVPR